MMRWVVLIAPLDETEANVYASEVGVSIRTSPERLGGYANERIVPWRRVLDYRKIGDAGTVTP